MSRSASTRSFHLTGDNIKSQIIEVAADVDNSPSKRYHILEEGDNNLNNNLGELETGTRARNRAFQDRLDAVWQSTKGFSNLVREERKEAAESILDIREAYQKAIDEFDLSLNKEVNDAFDHIEDDLYPVQVNRLEEIREGVNVFVQGTVPAAIEAQSGVVSRQLKKSYEAFAIEQQKEANRETKFVTSCNHLIQTTAQRFTDEAAFMAANLYTLEDDVVELERRAARLHVGRIDNAYNDMKDIRKVIKKEVRKRGGEDAILLDTVIDTQQLLQRTVIEHFGAAAEQGDAESKGEPISFDKLDARMARVGKGEEEDVDAQSGAGDASQAPAEGEEEEEERGGEEE